MFGDDRQISASVSTFFSDCGKQLKNVVECAVLFNRFAHSARPGTETQHSELDATSSTQRVGSSEFLGGRAVGWSVMSCLSGGRDQRLGA